MKKNELVTLFDEFMHSLGYNSLVTPYSSRFSRKGSDLYSDYFRVSGFDYVLNLGFYNNILDDIVIYVDLSRRRLNKHYFTYYSTYVLDLSNFPDLFDDFRTKADTDYFAIRDFIASIIPGSYDV